jgi:ABC-type Co2+ transport system permease subunit
MLLGAATAAGSLGVAIHATGQAIRAQGLGAVILGTALATSMTLVFFQLLPHPSVGVSEVHLILGSTLFLILGAGPAALGLAFGLLLQGLLFAPFDLPQYGMNVTTLLVPLFAMSLVARKIIRPDSRYVDLSYASVLRLSATFQAGIVGWVSFWCFWGQGFSMETAQSIGLFAGAYMTVVLIEPLVDLAVLAAARSLPRADTGVFDKRLHHPA